MNNELEEVVTELNYISAALDFLGDALECSESEGKKISRGGVSYIVRLLSQRSSIVSDLCWNIQSGCKNISVADNIES